MPTINTPTMAEIKARLAERDAKKASYKSTVSKDFYPFWIMAEGEKAVVRLIQDSNPDNIFPYYIDKFDHKLNIDGDDHTIVCPKTFDNAADCPICERSQKYYRDKNKDRGQYYWRNKISMVRLLVLDNPLQVEDENNEIVDYVGRVCTSQFGYQITSAIDVQLASFEDDEPAPWLIDDGYDFIIKKTAQAGGHPTYAFSSFAKRPSAIPEEYRDGIDFIDFRDLLPESPTLDKVQHYLDAHDGVVEFEFSKRTGGTESPTEDSKSTSKVKSVTTLKKPTASKISSTPVDNDDSDDTNDDTNDDDNDSAKLIRDIIKRKNQSAAR